MSKDVPQAGIKEQIEVQYLQLAALATGGEIEAKLSTRRIVPDKISFQISFAGHPETATEQKITPIQTTLNGVAAAPTTQLAATSFIEVENIDIFGTPILLHCNLLNTYNPVYAFEWTSRSQPQGAVKFKLTHRPIGAAVTRGIVYMTITYSRTVTKYDL